MWNGSSHCCSEANDRIRKAGGRGSRRGRCWMRSSTCCGLGCHGRRCLTASGASSRCMSGFGHWVAGGVSVGCGSRGSSNMTSVSGSTGSGRRWDGAHDESSLGGRHRPQSHRRGKHGTKRSLLVEGRGVPIGLTVDGANRHDMKLVERTWTLRSPVRRRLCAAAALVPRQRL